VKTDYLHTHSQGLSDWKDKEDSRIWIAFLKGNKSAYEFIYQHYVDELFCYGMSVKPNRSLVKDSIQDLFVELWNRRKNLSVTNNIKYYLYRSLRRKIKYLIDRERNLYDEKPLRSVIRGELVFPFEQKIITQQKEEERNQLIKRALLKLSDRQKEIINLIFFEQMSYEEVSEILLINIKSVYTLTWKAITSLKKNLQVILLAGIILWGH